MTFQTTNASQNILAWWTVHLSKRMRGSSGINRRGTLSDKMWAAGGNEEWDTVKCWGWIEMWVIEICTDPAALADVSGKFPSAKALKTGSRTGALGPHNKVSCSLWRSVGWEWFWSRVWKSGCVISLSSVRGVPGCSTVSIHDIRRFLLSVSLACDWHVLTKKGRIPFTDWAMKWQSESKLKSLV